MSTTTTTAAVADSADVIVVHAIVDALFVVALLYIFYAFSRSNRKTPFNRCQRIVYFIPCILHSVWAKCCYNNDKQKTFKNRNKFYFYGKGTLIGAPQVQVIHRGFLRSPIPHPDALAEQSRGTIQQAQVVPGVPGVAGVMMPNTAEPDEPALRFAPNNNMMVQRTIADIKKRLQYVTKRDENWICDYTEFKIFVDRNVQEKNQYYQQAIVKIFYDNAKMSDANGKIILTSKAYYKWLDSFS